MGSLGAWLAHHQTNTLHYRPIYLINWATLSAAQHSATHNCQQLPGSLKAPLPHPHKQTHTQTQNLHLPTDCLND